MYIVHNIDTFPVSENIVRSLVIDSHWLYHGRKEVLYLCGYTDMVKRAKYASSNGLMMRREGTSNYVYIFLKIMPYTEISRLKSQVDYPLHGGLSF